MSANPKYFWPMTAAMLIIQFVLIVGFYWRTVSFGLVWDDIAFLLQTDAFTASPNWLANAWEPFAPGGLYFRPLALMTYRLDYELIPGAEGHHLVQILLYALAFVLASLTCIVTIKQHSQSFTLGINGFVIVILTTTAFFTVNVESAAWVASRFDVLVMIGFSTLALVILLIQNTWILALLSATLYLATSLCKESAIVLPPTIAFIHSFYLYKNQNLSITQAALGSWNQLKPVYIGLMIGGSVYLILRSIFLEHPFGNPHDSTHYGSLINWMLSVSNSYWHGLWQILSPSYAAQPLYDGTIPPTLTPLNLFKLAGLMGLLGIVGFYIVKKRHWSAALFAVALFLFLPASHFIPMPANSGLGASRYLLLPSVFFSLSLISVLLKHFTLTARYTWKLAALSLLVNYWLISNIGTSGRYLSAWENYNNFWIRAYDRAPKNQLVIRNRVSSLFLNQDFYGIRRVLEKNKEHRSQWTFELEIQYINSLIQTNKNSQATKELDAIERTLNQQLTATPDNHPYRAITEKRLEQILELRNLNQNRSQTPTSTQPTNASRSPTH